MNPAQNSVEPRRPAWSRPEAVFIAASLALLIAFLVPVPLTALAALWVCTFCLAGAVTVICMVAGSSADLIGFVPLVVSLTLLRLAALAASARRIIQHQPTDPLLQSTGTFLAGQWPLGAVLICLLLAAVISVVVFASSQRIALASNSYIRRILPLKRVGIETDLRMGVIDPEQAALLARRLGSEFRFFAGMQGAALLMKGETAICVVVLLACALLPMAGGAPDMALTAAPATALAVFTMLPLVLVAAACGAMMSRDSLALKSEPEVETPAARKISIVAKTGDPEDLEVLNPESLEQSNGAPQFVDFEPASADELPADQPFQRELEALQNTAKASGGGQKIDFSCRSAEDYYEKLSRDLLGASPALKHIVLAAAGVKDLPVTVAVNIAIQLAQKQKKILLVDTNVARHPLARVFDLHPETLLKRATSTCFENVWVCAIPAAKIGRLFGNARIEQRFDLTLVYAPDCSELKANALEHVGGFLFAAGPDSAAGVWNEHLKTVPPVHSVLSAG